MVERGQTNREAGRCGSRRLMVGWVWSMRRAVPTVALLLLSVGLAQAAPEPAAAERPASATAPLAMPVGSGAVTAANPTVAPAPGAGSGEAEVVVFNRIVATFRSPLLGVPADERARRTRRNIGALLARGGPGLVTVKGESLGSLVLVDGTLGLILSPADLDPLQAETLDEATARAVDRLRQVIEETRESRSLDDLLRGLAVVLGATALYALTIALLRRARRALQAGLMRLIHGQADRLRVAGAEVLRRDRLVAFARLIAGGMFWVLALLLTYSWLGLALGSFPYTRPWGEQLQGYMVGVLAAVGGGILGALPDLATALLIFLIARGVVAALRPLFDHVERSQITTGWLDQDTAGPTRRIATLLIWLFALVMAYPYLPGAKTEAFKGMSVLLGLMVTLGASGTVGQAASGVILIFSRAVRRGEYVRVGEHEGTVTEIGLFITRLRTGLGEEVNLPNAMILSSATKNYSRAVQGEGYIVDTTVSIGYDTPWRQVEAMLVEAAARTPGVLAQPRPRVFQTALADYYPIYRLVAQAVPAEPRPRAEVLHSLHANIQDVFNEYGVQIMSPHYMADTAEPKLVPPSRWYAAPGSPPPGA